MPDTSWTLENKYLGNLFLKFLNKNVTNYVQNNHVILFELCLRGILQRSSGKSFQQNSQGLEALLCVT